VCVGGMGTAYSLPRSPDDYLSNVDEMDLQEDCKLIMRVISREASGFGVGSGLGT